MSPPSPQLENGHTRIANEVLEALARTTLSPYELRVLIVILRRTYGWQKKADRISLSQFTRDTGIDRRHVHRTIKNLLSRRLITVTSTGDRRPSTYTFQKDYGLWRLSPLQATGSQSVTSTGDKSVTSGGTHKRKIKKRDSRDTQKKRVRPSRASVKKKETDPNVSKFLSWWATEFQGTTGSPYLVNGGKEGSLVKRMLATFGYDRLEGMARTFLQSDDPFVSKAGRTIGVMASQANKLASDPGARPEPTIIPSEEFLRGAYAATT